MPIAPTLSRQSHSNFHPGTPMWCYQHTHKPASRLEGKQEAAKALAVTRLEHKALSSLPGARRELRGHFSFRSQDFLSRMAKRCNGLHSDRVQLDCVRLSKHDPEKCYSTPPQRIDRAKVAIQAPGGHPLAGGVLCEVQCCNFSFKQTDAVSMMLRLP